MSLTTRQFGPNPKNEKISILEMDNNLLYLQSLGLPTNKLNNSTTNPTILSYKITATGSFIDNTTIIVYNGINGLSMLFS